MTRHNLNLGTSQTDKHNHHPSLKAHTPSLPDQTPTRRQNQSLHPTPVPFIQQSSSMHTQPASNRQKRLLHTARSHAQRHVQAYTPHQQHTQTSPPHTYKPYPRSQNTHKEVRAVSWSKIQEGRL